MDSDPFTEAIEAVTEPGHASTGFYID